MEKAKIGVIQLFAMMFMFDLRTAVIVSYGITAKKDAWLAILFGMCGGIVFNFAEHMEEPKHTLRYFHPFVFMIFPLFMLLVAMSRNRFKKTKGENIKSKMSN